MSDDQKKRAIDVVQISLQSLILGGFAFFYGEIRGIRDQLPGYVSKQAFETEQKLSHDRRMNLIQKLDNLESWARSVMSVKK